MKAAIDLDLFAAIGDRISPPEAATFAFVMLVMTPCGEAYTPAQLGGMAKSDGFSQSALFDVMPPHRVVVSTK